MEAALYKAPPRERGASQSSHRGELASIRGGIPPHLLTTSSEKEVNLVVGDAYVHADTLPDNECAETDQPPPTHSQPALNSEDQGGLQHPVHTEKASADHSNVFVPTDLNYIK